VRRALIDGALLHGRSCRVGIETRLPGSCRWRPPAVGDKGAAPAL